MTNFKEKRQKTPEDSSNHLNTSKPITILFEDIDKFAESFWEKVLIKGEEECWEWQRALQGKGYGSVSVGKGKTELAHRVAYHLTNGEIPVGMSIMHKCDNRKCCNPSHLILGTNLDNALDMVAKGRQAKGEAHGMSKLTMEEAEKMRMLYQDDEISFSDLGSKFGVSGRTARGVVKGDYWKLPLAE